MADERLTLGSDADVIRQSLGDPEAFAAIFERHADSLHRYLAIRTGDRSAEDLVGETFALAFRCRGAFDLTRASAQPWLFGIATNVARHYWRSEVRRAEHDRRSPADTGFEPDFSDLATESVLFEAQSEAISLALAQIDSQYVEVLLLVAGPAFTYDEIAETLDIPLGTVRSRLARARRQLRDLLDVPRQHLDGVSQSREEKSR
jgi:RNA polymerase sigma factor (sigma-70 family)